jgi:Outer membrane protein beta-barrel domain
MKVQGEARVMSLRGCFLICLAIGVVLAGTARDAHAQAAQNTVVAGIGVVQYDLNGVGNAVGITIRGTRAVTEHLAIEASLPVSWPTQTFGDSRLFAPEAHLQYHWLAGRFRPYAGGGAGFAWTDAGALATSDVNLTLSMAGGTRFEVTDRFALLAELRLRGIERDFAGSTAEWLGGVSWRLGR